MSNPYAPLFFYYVGSDNQLTQCESSRIWWNASTVQGFSISLNIVIVNNINDKIFRTPTFGGIIPGGQSFAIPESSITTSSTQGTGFSWTPSIEGGTTLIIVAGDNRGMGSGGAAPFTVGLNNDGSCLNTLSPSSTAGTPAGAYSTSTATSSSGGSSSSSTSAASSSGR